MLREEDSSVQANSSAVATTHEGGDEGVGGASGGGGGGEEDKIYRYTADEGERIYGSNRWPRQETLALLKIRSDMDHQFRDYSLKGPLWEEVSRKLALLGYSRSAKKCREKFENVFKYHKRTREGRSSKADGKTYRFFEQLAALENHPPHPPSPSPPLPPQKPPTTNPINLSQNIVTPPILANPTLPAQSNIISTSNFPIVSANLFSGLTSSSTASDEEFLGRRKRKRKWKSFFERLTKQVMKKQEELQLEFLETIEKREHDRMVREESWRIQEMSRINRKHEILVQERSATAAKDAAVIALLHQISGSQPPAFHQTLGNQEKTPPPPPPAPPQHHQLPPLPLVNFYTTKRVDNGEDDSAIAVISTSSRWPKPEVQALISLRKSLDMKYQENEHKGRLWEEISGGMLRLGYNRSAKRCKEKWENMNKYFKKVKESNKQRPEDSKTCPYFHQLDALYKEKINRNNNKVGGASSTNYGDFVVKPINTIMGPLMVRPEQQWPTEQESNNNQLIRSVMEDDERDDIMDQNQEVETEEDGDTDDDNEAYGFELVPNKQVSIATTGE